MMFNRLLPIFLTFYFTIHLTGCISTVLFSFECVDSFGHYTACCVPLRDINFIFTQKRPTKGCLAMWVVAVVPTLMRLACTIPARRSVSTELCPIPVGYTA